MATIRFYTDEHVAWAVVKGLRGRGIDVLTVTEAGWAGATDTAHLARAQRDGRVVLTHDADFLRLHAAGVGHAGIVFASRELPIGDVIRGLMLIVQVLDAEDMIGHVEFL